MSVVVNAQRETKRIVHLGPDSIRAFFGPDLGLVTITQINESLTETGTTLVYLVDVVYRWCGDERPQSARFGDSGSHFPLKYLPDGVQQHLIGPDALCIFRVDQIQDESRGHGA